MTNLKTNTKIGKKQHEYKGKCRIDDDQLIIKGNKYSIETLHRLPSDIAPYKAAQINSETCMDSILHSVISISVHLH